MGQIRLAVMMTQACEWSPIVTRVEVSQILDKWFEHRRLATNGIRFGEAENPGPTDGRRVRPDVILDELELVAEGIQKLEDQSLDLFKSCSVLETSSTAS